MGGRSSDEGVWIGHGGLVRSRIWAVAVAAGCGIATVVSVIDAVREESRWSAGGFVLLFAAVMTMFLPPAVLGARRSPGVRLSALCTLVLSAAFVLFTVAARAEPPWLDPSRSRDQILAAISPWAAVLGFVLGLYLLRISFRTIEPTDYDARHAHDE